MTVKLDLTPKVEASLAAQAHARGLTLEAYLDQLLQSVVASKSHERDVFVVEQRDGMGSEGATRRACQGVNEPRRISHSEAAGGQEEPCSIICGFPF
jgi:hypothetical protein